MYKNQYTKRKRVGKLFLQLTVEPDWYNDVGSIVPLLYIDYKIYYKDENKEKAKVKLEIYGVTYYNLYINAKGCNFHNGLRDEVSEYIYSENTREFFRYLRNFQYDLRDRLEDVYMYFKDNMSENCRKIVEKILYEL